MHLRRTENIFLSTSLKNKISLDFSNFKNPSLCQDLKNKGKKKKKKENKTTLVLFLRVDKKRVSALHANLVNAVYVISSRFAFELI